MLPRRDSSLDQVWRHDIVKRSSDFIVKTFGGMGYIDCEAFPRGVQNIVSTIISEEQKIKDKAQLDKRMNDAIIAAAARRAPLETTFVE